MKKTTKTLAILAVLATFGTCGLFAQQSAYEADEIETLATTQDAKTIAVTIKVIKKKGIQNVTIKTKDGKTYIADSLGKDGAKAIEALVNRNGKKAVVSGYLNETTGVFNIVKMGGFNDNGNPDEK